ncbi:hypothetical protein ACLOJK_041711, partial [Asimina triloba]
MEGSAKPYLPPSPCRPMRAREGGMKNPSAMAEREMLADPPISLLPLGTQQRETTTSPPLRRVAVGQVQDNISLPLSPYLDLALSLSLSAPASSLLPPCLDPSPVSRPPSSLSLPVSLPLEPHHSPLPSRPHPSLSVSPSLSNASFPLSRLPFSTRPPPSLALSRTSSGRPPPCLSMSPFSLSLCRQPLIIAVSVCVTLAASMAARLGSVCMAAFQVCLQIWLTTSLLADGLAVAAQAILASAFANRDYNKAISTASRVLQLSVVMELSLAAFLGFGLQFAWRLFTKDVEVMKLMRIGIP